MEPNDDDQSKTQNPPADDQKTEPPSPAADDKKPAPKKDEPVDFDKLTPEELRTLAEKQDEELARTRRALKKANREAAARRLALKDKDQKKGGDEDDDEDETPALKAAREENARLSEEIKKRDHEAFLTKEKARVTAAAQAMGFVHPEDALALGTYEFDAEDPLTDEEIRAAVRTLAKSRPELIRDKESFDADSQRRGKGDSLPIDEAAIAQRFGVRNYVPTRKE